MNATVATYRTQPYNPISAFVHGHPSVLRGPIMSGVEPDHHRHEYRHLLPMGTPMTVDYGSAVSCLPHPYLKALTGEFLLRISFFYFRSFFSSDSFFYIEP